ncbi:putative holin-like toxin [Bacillus massiliglaciei]|nr:putative holin-like toxin [Bacillus massiliglaciei]
MTVKDALELMISFATLVLTIITVSSDKKKK